MVLLKQFYKEKWARIPPQWCEILIASYWEKNYIVGVAQVKVKIAQPVIAFRGQFVSLSHV